MTESDRRSQLTRFLKSCRARIAPAEAGLPESSERRRTAGLRREEVAALAGVSVTWYTWLEQGRDIQTSAEVLERLARTFRLTPDEREYLFELVQHRPPPLKNEEESKIDPAVNRMICSINVPAMLINIRWDILYWNDLAKRTFRDFGKLPPHQRNILKHLFTAPEYRKDPRLFEDMARRWVSNVRLDFARAAGDPEFDALIEELSEMCPVFRRAWANPSSVAHNEGVNDFKVPNIGRLTLEHTAYFIEGAPNLQLLMFSPYDAESGAALARLRDGTFSKKTSANVA